MRPRLLVPALLVLLVGCGAPDPPDSAAGSASSTVSADTTAADTATSYTATGVVRSVTPSGSHAMIRHGNIPGFMDAMTMAFAVADASLVAGIARDDSVRFRFTVGAEGTVIREINRVD